MVCKNYNLLTGNSPALARHIVMTLAPLSSKRAPMANLNGLPQTRSVNRHFDGTSQTPPDDSGESKKVIIMSSLGYLIQAKPP